MRYLIHAGRLLGGIVFIFSGFVKGVDPAGSQIKFSDYLTAAGFSLPENLLLIAAMLLCAAEFLIGVSLVTKSFYRAGVIGYAAFMAFFTPLTLVLAIYNPVSDCGCFGDAIHLTNWETFYKNLILLVPAIVMVSGLKRHKLHYDFQFSAAIMAVTTVMFTAFMLYNIRFNPVMDFRPYKTGTNIPESMMIPEGAPQDVYDIKLLYEKDGIIREFTINDYPANDTTWVFVDQKSDLIKKGYEPPIKDFNIITADGNDITDLVMYDTGYTLLMISRRLSAADEKDIEAGMLAGFNSTANNMKFYILTSSPRSEIETFQNGLTFCVADEVMLKTIVRTNPGYILLKDGTIIGKWSAAGLPEAEWFATDMTGKVLRSAENKRAMMIIGFFVLASSLLLLVFRKITNILK
jgi:hypothetical protein